MKQTRLKLATKSMSQPPPPRPFSYQPLAHRDNQAFPCLIITINDTCTSDVPLIITISDTSKNQHKSLDSDDHINVSRLIVCLEPLMSRSHVHLQWTEVREPAPNSMHRV